MVPHAGGSRGARMDGSGEKSTTDFELACSLLSRYVKGKGGFADLGLGCVTARPQEAAKGKLDGPRRPTTMSLLPGADVGGSGEEARDVDGVSPRGRNEMMLFPQSAGFGPAEEPRKPTDSRGQEKAQLTIFYGGKVLVFNNFPAEKANDLMQFAGTSNTNTQRVSDVPSQATALAVEIKGMRVDELNEQFSQYPLVIPTYIPVAPRNSLQRFLEKRKHRINASAPYQASCSVKSANPGKPE